MLFKAKEYRFFYNPMWGLMGDRHTDTAGTYYYSRSEHSEYFWNTFDQVLIRPELLDSWLPGDLRIVETVGPVALVRDDGRPNRSIGSDHLPIVFKIDV